jgi:hypothetical protein
MFFFHGIILGIFGGEDNYRSDVEEDLVVDAANTLSDKGRRGGNNSDDNEG